MNWVVKILLTIFVINCLQCSNEMPPTYAGGGVEVTNPSIHGTIRYPDSTYVVNAKALLRRENYLSPIGVKTVDLYSHDTLTDGDGYFVIDSILPGTYILEIDDGRYNSSIRKIKIDTYTNDLYLSTIPLKKSAFIKGVVKVPEGIDSGFIRVSGLERIIPLNLKTGEYNLNLPPGEFTLSVTTLSADRNIEELIQVTTKAKDSLVLDPFYKWKNSYQLKLNLTQIETEITENVLNFPLIVRLTGTNFDFNGAKNDGSDLRFSKSNGHPLSFEIEVWDSLNQNAAIWINIDTIYAGGVKQFINMYSGFKSTNSESNGTEVFKRKSGFVGNWHLKESPINEFGDSVEVIHNSVNGNYSGNSNGNMSLQNHLDGIVGNGLSLDGIDDHINVEYDSTMDIKQKISMSSWVNISGYPISHNIKILDKFNAYSFEISPKGELMFSFRIDTSGNDLFSDSGAIKLNQWYHVGVVYDNIRVKMYVNGRLIADHPESGSMNSNRNDLFMGGVIDHEEFLRGRIDEIALIDQPKSKEWFLLCYESQKPNSSLLEITQIKK